MNARIRIQSGSNPVKNARVNGPLFCIISDHLFCIVSDHLFCIISDHLFCIVSGHLFCIISDHLFCVISDHLFCIVSDHSFCIISDHLFCVISDHLFCIVSDHLFCIISDHCTLIFFVNCMTKNCSLLLFCILYNLTSPLSSLNEVQWPNKNHLRRLNTLLVVSIYEARNLERKKRYYCEIYLNDILYAQTCCKVMNDILFWGEPFIFE